MKEMDDLKIQSTVIQWMIQYEVFWESMSLTKKNFHKLGLHISKTYILN